MFKEEEIRKLIDSGEHWKAKELLQGNLSTPGYNTELFESYGYVLLSMNDSLEAGKYLFLSGVRKSEYSGSIGLFLKRYSKGNIQNIYDPFPKAVRNSKYKDYPEVVIQELKNLGFDPSLTKKVLNNQGKTNTATTGIVQYIIIFILILLLAGFFTNAGFGVVRLWNCMLS